MIKNIYHIHTYICKHSSNHLNELISYSLKHGYKELYFTEHMPIPIRCPYQNRRPSYQEIAELKQNIDLANKKYKNKLKIYFGYESEFNESDRFFYEKLVRDPYCEFAIFGNHYYGDILKFKTMPLVKSVTTKKEQLKIFNKNNMLAMSSGFFSWVAHPEIFLYSYKKWDKYAKQVCSNIINYAIKYKLPLAFNVNFPSYAEKDEWHYPCYCFWKMVKKTNIPVIIESDSHDIHTFKKGWLDKAEKLALNYGLSKNLTQKISINFFDKRPKWFFYEKKLKHIINPSLLSELKKKGIKFFQLANNTILEKQLFSKKAQAVWSIVLSTTKKLVKQVKKTSCYLISNYDCELEIKEFKKITNAKSLLKVFVREVC